ncbi:MAG: primosomal protein N' [Clostridia bacterium]|nr:primosomal protein N' [Clostridia bacterium]
MNKAPEKIGVRILDLPYHLDSLYTYYVPETLPDSVSRGDIVIVPFGAGNKKMYALVEETDSQATPEGIKPVAATVNRELSLSDEMLGVVAFLRERTFCTTGDAVRRLIPAEAFERADEYYTVCPAYDISGLNQKSRIIFEYIKSKAGGIAQKELSKEFSDDIRPLLSRLIKAGAIRKDLKIDDSPKIKTELIVSVSESVTPDVLSTPRTSEEQRQLFWRIDEAGRIPLSQLVLEGYSPARVKTLEKRGWLVVEKCEKLRIPYADAEIMPKNVTLSPEQSSARDKLCALMDGKPHGALLYGVTGSGKTSVMLSLCEEAVQKGKKAIVLVPEIALTWQSVVAFSSRFGDRLAVVHSALSGGERFDAYRRIKRGEIDVVLGTRSAVFAPLDNIALIVIDEEQEHTYKSDMSPKYSARDVARFRCEKQGALMLLCSATPSVESYYRATNGVYSLVELKERYGKAALPNVEISDMRADGAGADFKIIGEKLAQKLTETFESGHQSMLFLNRRGYSSFLICRKCGEALLCPHCSVALTLHNTRRGGELVCHYCGYRQTPPEKCPSCGSEHIGYMGYGTQALEEAIRHLLPQAKVIRMDADTTKGKFSRDEIISQFASNKADVLVGTQMIAKGHNFPNVTLAAVVNADGSLYGDDFRAAERTFSIITQLVGRSGRATSDGKAIIQTYSPDAEAIRLGAEQNYKKFYESEIAMRRALTFPPFCDIAMVSLSSGEEQALIKFSAALTEELKTLNKEQFSDVPTTIFGPFEASIYKLKNKYRMKIIIKHKNNARSRQMFSALLSSAEKRAAGKIAVSIDINPTAI